MPIDLNMIRVLVKKYRGGMTNDPFMYPSESRRRRLVKYKRYTLGGGMTISVYPTERD
jgi:hypothetical protein